MVSGSLTDGQLKIIVDKEAKVHLIFAGVSITNANSSAVVIEQAEKVITTLAADTTNTLTDGTSYTFAEGETEPDAAFIAKTICRSMEKGNWSLKAIIATVSAAKTI